MRGFLFFWTELLILITVSCPLSTKVLLTRQIFLKPQILKVFLDHSRSEQFWKQTVLEILFPKNGSLGNFYIMTLPERLSVFWCVVNFFQDANVQSQNWNVGYGFNNYDFHPSQINRNINLVVSKCGWNDWGFIGKHWLVSFQFQKPVKYIKIL